MSRDNLANRMLRRLCAFPSFRPSKNPDTEAAYIKAILGMLDEFGVEVTGQAIDAAVRAGGQFPPSAYDLRLFVPIAVREKTSDDTRDEMIAELKNLLCYYGDHQCTCGVPIGNPPCTCGWSKLLSQLLGEEEAAAVEGFQQQLASGIADGAVVVTRDAATEEVVP